jgi:hypothetical protein
MGDLRRLEIFRAGQHQDENGSVDAYSVDDLQQMVESFDPKLSCPLAVGHVDSSSPAYGWAKRLWVEGDRLFADVGDCVDEVKHWLKKKFYNKVSIEVFPPDHLSNPKPGKWNLARICLLGAAPPAIAGGPPVVPFRYAALLSPLKTYSYAANAMTPQEQLEELKAQIATMELEMGKQEFAAPPMDEEEEDLELFAAEDMEEEDPELFAAEDMPGEMGDDLMMDLPTEPMANPFIDELMVRAGLDLTAASDSSGVGLDLINEAIAGGEPLPEEDLAAVMDALFSGEMFSADMDEDEMEKTKEFAARLSKQEQELKRFSAFVTAEHKALQAERQEIERGKIRAFCAQLVTDLKIRPNEQETVAAMIESADHKTKRRYAAGAPEQSQREILMKSYSDRAPLVDMSAIDAGGSPTNASTPRAKAPRGYAASATEIETHRAIRNRMNETGEDFRTAYTAIKN